MKKYDLHESACVNLSEFLPIFSKSLLQSFAFNQHTLTRGELERDGRWSGFNDCSLHKISSTLFQGPSICHRKTCPTDVAFNIKVIYSQNEFALHTPIFLSCPFSKSVLPFFFVDCTHFSFSPLQYPFSSLESSAHYFYFLIVFKCLLFFLTSLVSTHTHYLDHIVIIPVHQNNYSTISSRCKKFNY